MNNLTCKICGYTAKQLHQHLIAKHSMSSLDYRKMYGAGELMQIGFSPTKTERSLIHTIRLNVHYAKSKERLAHVDLIPKKKLRTLLIQNNYYLQFIGKARNRTLLRMNPEIYKSVYSYTDFLTKLLPKTTLPIRLKYIVDYNYDISKFKCQCGKKYTIYIYCRQCPTNPAHKSYLGKSHSSNSKHLMRLAAIRNTSKRKGQIQPAYNINSIPIIEEYGRTHGYNFQHAENGGEVTILGYFVDGYDKEKNVVLEIDEKHHYKDGTLRPRDIIRQKAIEDHLGCKFIRIRYEK